MFDEEFMMLQIPARENVTIHFMRDKSVNNDSAYLMKHVRQLAFMLSQALPPHVLENLIREMLTVAQETIMRGARLEASHRGKRVTFSVQDDPESMIPGELMIKFGDNDIPVNSEAEEVTAIEDLTDLEDEIDE